MIAILETLILRNILYIITVKVEVYWVEKMLTNC